MKIYHGSPEIIEKPVWGKGKLYNDYGRGFYCTEHLELAKEWACAEKADGFANCYELDLKGLKILNLSDEKYNILHWIALLIHYRNLRLSSPVARRGAEWLVQHYLVDVESYDVIIGYRADDSYFSFARAFLRNEISLQQLGKAMELGALGEQVVLKTAKAFDNISYLSYEVADNTIYYVRRIVRDEKARQDYYRLLEQEDKAGIYMRDIMEGKDVRIQ